MLGLLIPLYSRSSRILGVRRVIRMMLAEIVVSMGSGFTTSEARELTSQWDFVTRSIARVKNRLRRDLILLGYKDSLSKKNLEEVLRGGDSIVLSEVSLGGVGEA
jgi:hypothetical protein